MQLALRISSILNQKTQSFGNDSTNLASGYCEIYTLHKNGTIIEVTTSAQVLEMIGKETVPQNGHADDTQSDMTRYAGSHFRACLHIV